MIDFLICEYNAFDRTDRIGIFKRGNLVKTRFINNGKRFISENPNKFKSVRNAIISINKHNRSVLNE